MAIAKKELGSPATSGESVSSTLATLPPRIENYQPGLTKDQSIARSVSINNTFGAGWFKDTCQVMPLEDAVKKAFEVAGQIEAWLTR
ncbi:MAG: hypothetical protein IPL32_19310 [Chloracidobacterium sp.]|nr:hypothetical protein [Chloracidobacterium sp.]